MLYQLTPIYHVLYDFDLFTPVMAVELLKTRLGGDYPDPVVLSYCTNYPFCHAVVPISVMEAYLPGGTEITVGTYDPNQPGKFQPLYVQPDQNTYYWLYNRISLADLSLFNQFALPLAGQGVRQGSLPGTTIWDSGYTRLTITDPLDRRMGYTDAGYVNEIPSGQTIPLIGGARFANPVYTLPLTPTLYTISLEGAVLTYTQYISGTGLVTMTSPPTPSEPGTFHLVGLEGTLRIDNLLILPGETDVLVSQSDGSLLGYSAGALREGVNLETGFDPPGESWSLALNDMNLYPGKTFTMTTDRDQGVLVLDNRDHWGFWTHLEIEHRSQNSSRFFRSINFPVEFEDVQYVQFGGWDGMGPITILVDHGGDGTIDETRVMDNQGTWYIFLPLIMR